MNALLATDSLSLRFGGITALNDVSLAVSAGEMLAIVGPNGAGKTSLLNCVTGAYHATSGRITFNGEDITRAAAHTATQRGIARTFQHNELFPQMTVVENLLLGRQADLAYSLFAAAVYWGRCQRWELEEREKVRDLADRVFVLHYGSKLASGPTEQVLADPKVIEAYIGKHKGVHTSDR
jgi:branched-chain amino acid transport system ATP-binding protein